MLNTDGPNSMPTDCISMHAKNVMAMYENTRLKISIEPINIRFPDATNEILEPLKLPSVTKTWRPLMVAVAYGMVRWT